MFPRGKNEYDWHSRDDEASDIEQSENQSMENSMRIKSRSSAMSKKKLKMLAIMNKLERIDEVEETGSMTDINGKIKLGANMTKV